MRMCVAVQEWQPQHSRNSSQGYAHASAHSRSASTHRWALPPLAAGSSGTQSAPHLRPPPKPARKTPPGPPTAPGLANFGSLPPPRRGSVGVSANGVIRQQSLSAAQQAASRPQFESSLRQDGPTEGEGLPALGGLQGGRALKQLSMGNVRACHLSMFDMMAARPSHIFLAVGKVMLQLILQWHKPHFGQACMM